MRRCAERRRRKRGSEVSDEGEEQQQRHLLDYPINVFVVEVWSSSEERLVHKVSNSEIGWGSELGTFGCGLPRPSQIRASSAAAGGAGKKQTDATQGGRHEKEPVTMASYS